MSEFTDELHEVFERFGRISVQRMFGGYGIYHEERMFALVSAVTRKPKPKPKAAKPRS